MSQGIKKNKVLRISRQQCRALNQAPGPFVCTLFATSLVTHL